MNIINLKLKSILLIVGICIAVLIFLQYPKILISTLKVNATPITSKIIVLDARSWYSR